METFEHNGFEYCTEESRLGGNYRNIILFTYTGVDLRTLSEDGFVDLMRTLLTGVSNKYSNLVKEEIERNFAERRERILHNATVTAACKWKTEKKRQEYINAKMAEYDEQQNTAKRKFPNDEIFFDFWPGPHHGLPGVCSGLTIDTEDCTLHRAWEHLHENEWFNKGFGLVFKYETHKDTYLYSFRPWIEVVMSDEDKAAAEAGQKAIDDEIDAFYRGSRYCGD